MKQTTVAILASFASSLAGAQSFNFDADVVGAVPAGWTCGTGGGKPRWAVAADPGAPSKPNALVQSGSGAFPWCVKNGTSLADGFAEVKFKAVSGLKDQAGGLVWRWKDQNRYYVARANALENNVALYYVDQGSRNTLKYVNAPVAAGSWHILRVEFAGTRIVVSLNGKRYIEVDDSRISGAGSVGVWTKADSVTAFDDFAYTPPVDNAAAR